MFVKMFVIHLNAQTHTYTLNLEFNPVYIAVTALPSVNKHFKNLNVYRVIYC